MKDVRMRITMETCDNIVNALQERQYDIECVPGGLMEIKKVLDSFRTLC